MKPQLAAVGERHRNTAENGEAEVNDSYVINLCSSTTPMALVHPEAPELKRFRFFVSRRLEDGRERFRLHMGHFQSLEEAEDWLCVVRDVYPGAWAGEMPGKRLRARVAEVVQSTLPAASNSASSEESTAGMARPSPSVAAAASLATPADATATLASLLPPASSTIPKAAALRDSAAPVLDTTKRPVPGTHLEGRRDAETATVPSPARAAPLAPLSNVREVLAALDERDSRRVPAAAAIPLGAAAAALAPASLSDTQVMQFLEARGERGRREAVPSGIPMLRPDDSGTRRSLHAAVLENAAVSFAVQLQWSVRPMTLDKVPPLAIFSAYTLYTVQGEREGRAWYGLRLGFFADAVAAKQVAHYVRSDFASVAVVPVSAQERGRATSTNQKISAPIFAEHPPAAPLDEITLFDGERAAESATRAWPAVEANALSSAVPRAARARNEKLRGKDLPTESKRPNSLEETLEILGADDLEIDNSRGEPISLGRVRHLHVELRKDSPFQKLIARLTERVRKS